MNLVLHIINVLLLFGLLRRITKDSWRSGFVAVLFALHPLAVDTVAWVSERKELLCVFFGLLSMWAYASYVAKPQLARYLLSLGLFVIGLMAKPMLATFPLILLLLDYWPLRRMQFHTGANGVLHSVRAVCATAGFGTYRVSFLRAISEKLPFLTFSVVQAIVTVVGYQSSGFLPALQDRPIMFRVANALDSYVIYLRKMIWPTDLAVIYPIPTRGWWLWHIVGAGLGLALFTVWAFKVARRRPYVLVGWLWYLGTLIPVIGLVQHGEQSMADHYTYLPLIGIYIALTWSIGDWHVQSQYRTPFVGALIALALCPIVVCTWFQVGYWRDSLSLFRRALAVTTANPVAHHQIGLALANEGRLAEAEVHFTRVVRMNPLSALGHRSLGIVQTKQGKFKDAILHFSEALRINPGDVKARQLLLAARQLNRKRKVSLETID